MEFLKDQEVGMIMESDETTYRDEEGKFTESPFPKGLEPQVFDKVHGLNDSPRVEISEKEDGNE